MENKLYLLARQLGVLDREAFLWTGDTDKAKPADPRRPDQAAVPCARKWPGCGSATWTSPPFPARSTPSWCSDKVQNPPDPAADFPTAPVEPAIYKQLRGPHRMIIGLANDEIGYIIPKRQWDEKPPFCYGRKKSPYGEINSLGPDTAPVLCEAFLRMTR